MRKTAFILAVIMLICCTFCACNEGGSIIGTWTIAEEGVEMTFTFNEDGTGSLSAMAGLMSVQYTYNIDGDQIVFYELNQEVLGSEPFTFSVSGDELTLTSDGEKMVLTRK